jgi:type VI secretion system protein
MKFLVSFLRPLVTLLAVSLASCTVEEMPELSIETVSIYAEPEANHNSAIAVDLVLVYNADLLKTIGKMSAAKYFAASRQLLLDNPSLLDIWRWELVPGQMVSGFMPDHDKGDAYGGYVFANYLTPGDHRTKVGPDGVVNILLLRDDMQNLAMNNAHDVKVGTTMSTLTCAKDMCGYNKCCDEREFIADPALSSRPMGPCQGPAPTCQRRALPPCPPKAPCPSPSRPVQIITQPLDPLSEDTLLGY